MISLKKRKANMFNLNPLDYSSKIDFEKHYNHLHYKSGKLDKKVTNRRKKYNKFYKIKVNYNLNIEEYKKLMNLAKYECEVCGITNNEHKAKFKAPLYVDHNHKTNEIRGILCSKCNFVEGHINKMGISPNEYWTKYFNYINKESAYIKSLNIWRSNGRKNKIIKLK